MAGRRMERTGESCIRQLLTVVLCFLSISSCFAFSFLHGRLGAPQELQKSALRMSSEEDDDPAISAIKSLAEYHQGEWKGRARSFTVTPDTAAGIVKRKLSQEYTVSVKLSASSGSSDPSTGATPGTTLLTETTSWDNKFSHRSIPLSTSSDAKLDQEQSCSVGDIDVDDVDASYSLDVTQPTKFPSILTGLSGNNSDHTKKLQFIVEHCIAVAEDRRCRCFAIYGKDESLLRVVISTEDRVKKIVDPGEIRDEKVMSTLDEFKELGNDIDRLLDKISSNINDENSTKKVPRSLESFDRSADIDRSNAYNDASSRLDALGKSIANSKSEEAKPLSPHHWSLLEATNGVWLGDVIIRETKNVAGSPTPEGAGKGFGKIPASPVTRSFAEWNIGVQKVAWRWVWRFEEEIRQIVNAGKSLGFFMDDFMKQPTLGRVCVDESFSRKKPKDERMVYIDWEQDSVGFLLGPFTVRLPRYVNFDPSATTSRAPAVTKPFYTEFGIFQNEGPADSKKNSKILCSKISRLYNFEGRLKQGCTSFYTFESFDDDDEEEEEAVEVEVVED